MTKITFTVLLCLGFGIRELAAVAAADCYVGTVVCENREPDKIWPNYQPLDVLGNPNGPTVNVPVQCKTNLDVKAVNTRSRKISSGYFADAQGDRCANWVAKKQVGVVMKDEILGPCGDARRGLDCPSIPVKP